MNPIENLFNYVKAKGNFSPSIKEIFFHLHYLQNYNQDQQ